MQCGILDWTLESKKDFDRKTGEIQIKSIVNTVPILIY